jgi:hypothetical protein
MFNLPAFQEGQAVHGGARNGALPTIYLDRGSLISRDETSAIFCNLWLSIFLRIHVNGVAASRRRVIDMNGR